jgi:hypothetical protein
MDIGVWMNGKTLAHKLEAQDERNPEEAWNLARWPRGLAPDGNNRLFVASDGYWRGYFQLSKEALFNPEDTKTPYTLLFDTRTWTEISPTPAKRFQGFTYAVPASSASEPTPPPH